MATEKVTAMTLKVDLQCPCCYKKVKKTLCKFPQIRDQVYDEKNNVVGIRVVCCSPEKIRDKLCCKGGKAIKSITIVDEPKEKPKEPEKPKEKPKEPEKPKEKPKVVVAAKPKEPEKPMENPKGPEKPKEKPAEPEKSKVAEKPESDGGAAPAQKPKSDGGAAPAQKPKDAPKPEPVKVVEPAAMPPAAMQVMRPGPTPVHGIPSIFPYNGPSHDAYAANPYYHGYGFPPPQPLYEGYYGHGHGHGHGHGYGNGYEHGGVAHVYAHRNDNYFSDEKPQTCTFM